MTRHRILIPIDLTPIAGQAIRQAAAIAKKAGEGLSLLHVMDEKREHDGDIEKKLEAQAEMIRKETGLECDVLAPKGNIFDVIPEVARERKYNLIVIGTHGIKGVKQLLFGANILKLVIRTPKPVMVVQEESPVIEEFQKLVLPVSSHLSFKAELDAALFFAGLYDTEIHLYSVHKAGFDWPEQMVKNIEEATHTFEKKSVHMKRIKEEQNVYSLGYAKQTLNYAGSVNADLISMMSIPSKEYYYFAQSDKESLLLNDLHIPVLCAGGEMQP
jgi:nucleotide-binding universal stress UspA family protein